MSDNDALGQAARGNYMGVKIKESAPMLLLMFLLESVGVEHLGGSVG